VRSKSGRKPVYRAYRYRTKMDDEKTDESRCWAVLSPMGAVVKNFFTYVSHTAHVIAIGWTSVCPSHAGIVSKRLNLSSHCIFTACSSMILVFWGINFPGIPLGIGNIPTGALNARGRKKLQFPTNISLIARKRLKIDAAKFWSLSKFWTYGLNYWETVEDRWVHAAMHSVWQAFNPLSIHVTFTAIVPGAYPGEVKMCRNWRNS